MAERDEIREALKSGAELTRRKWEQRVDEADGDAEAATVEAMEYAGGSLKPEAQQAYALIAIAAELRAQRIARRPGAGS